MNIGKTLKFSLLFLGLGLAAGKTHAVPISLEDFSSSAAIIDFEGPTTALPVIPGVTFPQEGPINGPGWFASTTSFTNTFFGNKVFANLVSSAFSDLAIEFATPVQAVGGWVGQLRNFLTANPETITFSIFGANGLLEEVEVLLPVLGFSTPAFVGLRSDAGITRVEWRNGNTGFFGVDNVIYGAAAVPEPQTWLLTLAGLGLLGFVASRSRQSPA